MKRNVLRSQENYNKPSFNISQLTIYVQFYERVIDFEARCIYKQDLLQTGYKTGTGILP